MDKNSLKLKYTATTSAIVIYYALLLFDMGLLLSKNIKVLHTDFGAFYSHISNFVISSILVSIISLIWLLQGAPFKLIIWLGVVAIVLNFIIELFVRFLNTPDVIDAVYGTAGVIFTVLIMLLLKKTGLKENTV
jgi:hypothetical protein